MNDLPAGDLRRACMDVDMVVTNVYGVLSDFAWMTATPDLHAENINMGRIDVTRYEQ